ncbi:MAG: histidinol-phosphatase [Oscillospiraceae bacterium]|nr:histidinol-phosphatase [Oscillospiraceae bacterium]
MKITSTLHNHCTMCDGNSTLDEMIKAAISAGFSDFGMSCHGYAPFDPEYSMPGEEEYIAALADAKEKYASDIRIWTGVEEDYFAPSKMPEKYDYIIGDVHYAKDAGTGELIAIDGSPQNFCDARDKIFGGDAMALVKDYFANMVSAAEKNPTVLGHFDLVVKNNKDNCFFDEESDEYLDTALEALKACNGCGVIFEVNTGAIVRKKRDLPYPSPYLLKELREMGGKVTLSADCHDAVFLTGGFDLGLKVIREAGFKSVLVWENGKFIEKEI